jgi:hypothetical protein
MVSYIVWMVLLLYEKTVEKSGTAMVISIEVVTSPP